MFLLCLMFNITSMHINSNTSVEKQVAAYQEGGGERERYIERERKREKDRGKERESEGQSNTHKDVLSSMTV